MIISIDIGTSYSSICMLGPDGKAHPVDVSTGASMFGSKYSLPSAVFVEDSGKVLVGQAAMNSRKHKPQNFRMEFKRNLGEDIPILLGGRSFKPEALYTELFRHMKSCAEKVSGEAVEKAYLTYPASYGEKRREKLSSAAKAAGLFDLELVDEPTAAAMCYCAEGYIKDGQTLLVYDFGGGTFDVSLIKYQNNEFQLLSEPTGLERCGGMDIDYLIAQDMRAAIEQEIPGAWDNLQKNQNRFLRFTSQINELAVKAKHHLSSAGVFEEYIEMGMDDVPYKLTVERFNEMIAPLVGQTVQTCRRALNEAGISASDVSAVLMVGGTSRIPLVQELARKITGKPALCAADLELAVAQGALLYNEYQKKARTAEMWYGKGLDAQAREDWTEAAVCYRKAADLGHAYAMNNLGLCYGNGTGVTQSFEQAVEWLRKAADLGDAGAMYNLGLFYARGTGVAQSFEQAVEWYRKAADLGNADAMGNLGKRYYNGTGVAQSFEQAVEWFRKTADLGHVAAMNNLGVCYDNGTGVAQSFIQAVEWYRKAADLGDAAAMYNLGVCYKNGTGVARSFERAVEWFRKAADLGDTGAMVSLGGCYYNGTGVARSFEQAVEWARKAADLGNANAMFNLGVCYETGTGVAQSYKQAVEWYRKAADLEFDKAVKRLQELGEY